MTFSDKEITWLDSGRVQLRGLSADQWRTAFLNWSDERLIRWFGLDGPEELEKEKQKALFGWRTFNRDLFYFHFVLKETGEVIGDGGFHTWYLQHRRAEIGYRLLHDRHKGRGYMREILPLILAYGFEQMDLNRIEAMVAPLNEPSLRLLRNNGFQEEGLLRSHYNNKGVMEDSLVFGLLRQEWEKQVRNEL